MPLQLDLKHSKWKMLQLDAVTIYYKVLTKDKLLAKIPNTSTNKDSPGLTEREYKLKKKKRKQYKTASWWLLLCIFISHKTQVAKNE